MSVRVSQVHARVSLSRTPSTAALGAQHAVHCPSLSTCSRHHRSAAAASSTKAAKIDNVYLNQPSLDMAAGWKSLQSGIASLNLGQSANKIAKGFNSSVQATKERLGQVAAEDITELPQGIFMCSEQ